MINRYRLTSTVYEREDESQKVLPEKRIFLSVEGNATEKEYFDGKLTVDTIEELVDDSYWPIPTYVDLLFGI